MEKKFLKQILLSRVEILQFLLRCVRLIGLIGCLCVGRHHCTDGLNFGGTNPPSPHMCARGLGPSWAAEAHHRSPNPVMSRCHASL